MGRELIQAGKSVSTVKVVLEQLVYLEEVYDRDGNFRSVPPGKLTIGVIAAKEFDVSHPKFANVLGEIDYALDHPDS